jgi:hypothetical protein
VVKGSGEPSVIFANFTHQKEKSQLILLSDLANYQKITDD